MRIALRLLFSSLIVAFAVPVLADPPVIAVAKPVAETKPVADAKPAIAPHPVASQEWQQIHRFDRHTPFPATASPTTSPAGSVQHFRNDRTPENVVFIASPFYPAPGLYAAPLAPQAPAPVPVSTAAFKSQEIYFTTVSRVQPEGNTLWLSGTAYMTFDDRSGYQFLPVIGDNVEVRIENADSIFTGNCLASAQNPIVGGTQLVVSGLGRYDYQQPTPDKVYWRFEIAQPLLCAVSPETITAPPGNYGQR